MVHTSSYCGLHHRNYIVLCAELRINRLHTPGCIFVRPAADDLARNGLMVQELACQSRWRQQAIVSACFDSYRLYALHEQRRLVVDSR